MTITSWEMAIVVNDIIGSAGSDTSSLVPCSVTDSHNCIDVAI